jgi:hypothetical protein
MFLASRLGRLPAGKFSSILSCVSGTTIIPAATLPCSSFADYSDNSNWAAWTDRLA